MSRAWQARLREAGDWWAAYAAYLESPEWEAKRALALERARHWCEDCSERRATQVHHRSYRNVGDEQPHELVAICAPCHEARHPHLVMTFAERWAAAKEER